MNEYFNNTTFELNNQRLREIRAHTQRHQMARHARQQSRFSLLQAVRHVANLFSRISLNASAQKQTDRERARMTGQFARMQK